MTREISIAFQTDKSPAQYVALAKLVNTYRFDAVSVYCDAPFHPSFGPLLLMAPHIEHARIGPAAVSPSRIAPIDIAAETALLAQVAKGDVYLGLARGGWLKEHGIKEVQPPIQAIREAIDVIRLLLSGKTGGYQGQIFQLAEHVHASYPLPDKSIPVLIGTWGNKLGALAGEIADEVKIGGTANPDIVPLIREYIAKGERRAGRTVGSVGIAVGAVTVADEDREQARQLARREVALYLPIVTKLDTTIQIEPDLIQRLEYHARYNEYDIAGNLISDDLLNRFAFAGDANDITRQSESLFDAGASRIEFGTPHGIVPEKGIRILGEQLIPALS